MAKTRCKKQLWQQNGEKNQRKQIGEDEIERNYEKRRRTKNGGKKGKNDGQKMAGKVKDGIQNNVAGSTGDSMLAIEEG